MAELRPVRELVEFYIGGGWGSDEPGEGLEQVAIIRGADFPSVAAGDSSGVPMRWEERRKVARRALREGDLALEISGGTKDRPTGRTVFVSAAVLQPHTTPVIPASFCRLIRPDVTQVVPRYLYYWLQDMYRDGRTWGYQVQSTGLANFNIEWFLDRELVRVPTLGEQQRVAEALGSLDDLINTNERTISALGRTADHLFGAFDPVIELKAFAEVVDIFGGGTPSTSNSDYWGGDVRWATPTDLTALSSPYLFDTAKKITSSGLEACSSRLHPVGSILMTSRATIGRIAVAQRPTATNQGFIVLRPRSEVDRWFLFHELRTRVEEFISRANGSTFLEISRGTFKTLVVRWPSEDDRQRLHAQLAPLHEAAISLEVENEQLRRTRDELLPLLMSGAVRVRPEGVAA